MLGHLDPYTKKDEVVESLELMDKANLPVNLVLGSKIYKGEFEKLNEISSKMNHL